MGLKVRSTARPKDETGILLQIGVRTRWMLGQKVLHRVEISAPCRTVEFFYIKMGKPFLYGGKAGR